MNYNSVFRTRLITFFTIAFALCIIGRLYLIQIVRGEEYKTRAEKKYIKPTNSTFDRGTIFFTSKDDVKVAAASIKEGYTISINPKLIEEPIQVYTALSQYIDIDKDLFTEKASKRDDAYEEIQKRVSSDIGKSITGLRIPGVNATRETWRVYPAGSLAVQSVGIVGLDKENILAGRYGLESYYEDILARKGVGSSINFFAEIFSGIVGESNDKKEGDIVISIEPTVESYLENTLLRTQKKWDSDSIGGIIMDPKTGEIYAMGESPSFNPNDLSNIENVGVFSNSLVEDVFEVGSIIKPLTMAVGLDSGAITPKSTYKDDGFLLLSGRKISNYDGKARGVVSMQEVLSQSLNTGAATIALKTGSDKFAEYFLNLGFGRETGIDEPNEQKGIIKNLTTKRDIEIATASYGQGIAMTPIQTIRALATLANGGLLVTPHIAKEIEYRDGENKAVEFPKPTEIFKKESVEAVTGMLVNVVDKALQKGEVKMDHYSIAAKTGTAQIADPINGGYYKDRYLHSFFGYFPAYNPRFIVYLYHVYPKNVEYASETLTHPFMELTKLLINYYEIPPDR